MCDSCRGNDKQGQILSNLLPPGSVSPSAERNGQAILEVLRRVLPDQGTVLEIASGTGQHVVRFARALPLLVWQPSDPDPDSRQSIRRWIAHEQLPNVRDPIGLDVCLSPWAVASANAVICINMVHISPWEATRQLVRGAGGILARGGILYLYGPYRRGGCHNAPSNAAFDADLRARNPSWGVRDLEAVQGLAEEAGFGLEEIVPMPANNLSVVLRRVAT